MVLSAVPSAEQVLLTAVKRCRVGDLSASDYAPKFAVDLEKFVDISGNFVPQSQLQACQPPTGESSVAQQRHDAQEECPLCGDRVPSSESQQHVAAEWQQIEQLQQRVTQQHIQELHEGDRGAQQPAWEGQQRQSGQHGQSQQPTILLSGMQQLLDTVLTSPRSVVRKAFAVKEPSMSLVRYMQGVCDIQYSADEQLLAMIPDCWQKCLQWGLVPAQCL